ncbi:hypothetical protein STFE110948_02775 [Streptobacillus felis]|uniref:hypothetical protein n=1 Tax=Streptobacillus felis TaxID=1384509 RepID=UPI000834EDE7|nr:hypothetical protein [Streptobacillus felis]
MSKNMMLLYGGILSLFAIFSMVSHFMNKKSLKKQGEDFLAKHPNAVKIFTKSGGFIVTDTMNIIKVNGEYATHFSDETGEGAYALPGTNEIVAEYSWTRPGVLHKTVTTSTGETTFDVELKSGRDYKLTFDKKESTFKIDEK